MVAAAASAASASEVAEVVVVAATGRHINIIISFTHPTARSIAFIIYLLVTSSPNLLPHEHDGCPCGWKRGGNSRQKPLRSFFSLLRLYVSLCCPYPVRIPSVSCPVFATTTQPRTREVRCECLFLVLRCAVYGEAERARTVGRADSKKRS
ncbi:hypothetical protein BKA80DRAFT_142050 [Phyllosticta citrichinensis]